MTQFPTRGGIDSFGLYKIEATYGTDPGTWTADAEHFGMTQKVTPSAKRTLNKIRGLSGTLPTTYTASSSRASKEIFSGKFEVGCSVEFQPQTFDFMELVMGSKSGSDPYYYPQSTAATESDKKKYTQAKSFSVMTRFDFGGTVDASDKVWIYSGMIVNSFTLKAAMGEAVSCTLDCVGATMTASVTTVATSYPFTALSSADVYNFVQCDVEYGGVSITNIIDGFDLTIGNNAEILYGLGSVTGKHGIVKALDVSLTVDLTFEGTQFFDDFMGAATSVTAAPVEIETIELKLVKSASVDCTITLKNVKIASPDIDLAYGEISKEKLNLEAEWCYIVENQA